MFFNISSHNTNDSLVAKTVLISVFLSLFILSSVLYLTRSYIFNYVMQNHTLVQNNKSDNINNVSKDNKNLIVSEYNELIVSTVKKVNPAVVSIIVTKDVPKYEKYYESVDPWGMFGVVPRVRENGTEEREVGGGSGFLISADGLIVTNRHVVDDKNAKYSILLSDGTDYQARVKATDTNVDVAVLQIIDDLSDKKLPYLTFGDSGKLRLGETVIAIGNALAKFRNSVSVGVVSGVSRSIVASDGFNRESLNNVIQTDAAINPGNSGGPLINLNGEVVGVNVAVSRGADNIGFALPSNVVKTIVDSVKKYGEIVKPQLGVRYRMIDKILVKKNNLPVDYGALVVRGRNDDELAVLPGSPADVAGITENTIILSVDGEKLKDRDLATVLRTKKVGQKVELEVIQRGKRKKIMVELGKAS